MNDRDRAALLWILLGGCVVLGSWNLWLTDELSKVRSVAYTADDKATNALNKAEELEDEVEARHR